MPIRVTSKRAVAAPPAPAGGAPPFGLPPAPAGVAQKPPGVSLCMIVKNEERFLEACLRSAADAVDEICVVDTGSTDRTVEIAEAFGARVVRREWRNDFAWARNEAISLATRRWILMLDADEELTPESKPALELLKTAPASEAGVWIRCYNRSDDYGGTGSMSHALVRIFPNSERVRFRGLIHEFVTLDNGTDGLAAVMSPVAIVHHGYLKEIVEGRDKARRNFEIVSAAAQASPEDPFAWFNVGSTAFLMGDFEQSRDAFERMRTLNGTARRGFIPNGLAILAEVYCDKFRDAKKSEEISRAALDFSPRYSNAHFQLGKALVAQQRFDEARQAFEEAIADGAHNAQQFVVDDQVSIWKSHSEIGSTYVMQGDDRRAIEWFRAGMANAPAVQPLRLNLARALERSGELDEARALFKGVFEDFGDGPSVVDWVNFLLRRKEPEAALAVIDARVDPLEDAIAVPLLLAAAQVAASLGANDRVAGYLERGALRVPGNAEILNWLEGIYRERGDAAALTAMLEREAAAEPKDAADFLRRSYQANVAHDFARGLELARAGLEREPANEHLHYNAAVAASSLGELDGALEHLENVKLRGTPVYVPAETLRFNIFRTKGMHDEAVAALERILAEDPANFDALAGRAALFEQRGDLGAAEASLRRMLEADPRRGAIEVASFLLRHGRFEEAARMAETGLQQ